MDKDAYRLYLQSVEMLDSVYRNLEAAERRGFLSDEASLHTRQSVKSLARDIEEAFEGLE